MFVSNCFPGLDMNVEAVLHVFLPSLRCSLFQRTLSHQHKLFHPKMAVTRNSDALVFYHPDQPIRYEDTRPLPDPKLSKYSFHRVESEVLRTDDESDVAAKRKPTVTQLARMFNVVRRNIFRSYTGKTRVLKKDRFVPKRPFH